MFIFTFAKPSAMLKHSICIFLLIIVGKETFSQSVFKDQRTGVIISFHAHDDMFPKSWWENDEPYYESIPASEYARSRKLIEAALNKYPAWVINHNLKKIYVLHYLSFDDVSYGGTYSNDALFVVNGGLANWYDDLFVEQTFHHEFSSMLFNNYVAYFAESETAWSICATRDAEYGKGGFNAIKDGEDSMDFDEELNEQGFLHQYGQSDKENDINSFAENLFAPSEGFWEVVNTYPALKCKIDLMMTLYQMLDPKFTREYFLALDQWKNY